MKNTAVIPAKAGPMNFNVIVLPQPFNTPGNEIAPRSGVIREYIESHGFIHKHPFFNPFLDTGIFPNTEGEFLVLILFRCTQNNRR